MCCAKSCALILCLAAKSAHVPGLTVLAFACRGLCLELALPQETRMFTNMSIALPHCTNGTVTYNGLAGSRRARNRRPRSWQMHEGSQTRASESSTGNSSNFCVKAQKHCRAEPRTSKTRAPQRQIKQLIVGLSFNFKKVEAAFLGFGVEASKLPLGVVGFSWLV